MLIVFFFYYYFFVFFIYFRGRSVSSEHDNSESEHSEKSPLVSAKLDSLAKLLFSKSFQQDNGNTNKESDTPTRFCRISFTFKNKNKIIIYLNYN